MSGSVETPKTTRPRRHFAIVSAELDGVRYRFSLTRQGLVVQQRYRRRKTTLTFKELEIMTRQQRSLL